MSLEIISGGGTPRTNYRSLRHEAHCRCFMHEIQRNNASAITFHGVKWLGGLGSDDLRGELCENVFVLCQRVLIAIGELTPSQLIHMFPPDKKYNGQKWGSKDYFTTMEAINAHGIDSVIGDRATDLLFDWMNIDICRFYVIFMMAINRMSRRQGIEAPIDRFVREHDIETMSLVSMSGKSYFQDKNGHYTRVRKPLPRGWKLWKGGAG